MAEFLLAKALPTLHIESAGIGALVGYGADKIASDLMEKKGIDISSHKARQIDETMCSKADIILVMEYPHRKFIEKNYPSTRGKVFRLLESDGIDIPDPYQQGEEAFTYSLKLIEDGVQTWTSRIEKLRS